MSTLVQYARRFCAGVLLVALVFDPGLQARTLSLRACGLLAQPRIDFMNQALDERSAFFERVDSLNSRPAQQIARELGSQSRRQFFQMAGALAVVMGSPLIVDAQVISEKAGEFNVHQALPFPPQVIDYAALPAETRRAVDVVDAKLREFRNECLEVQGSQLTLNLKSTKAITKPMTVEEGLALYEQRRIVFFTDLANALLKVITPDLPVDQKLELTERIKRSSPQEQFSYFYNYYFPAYFARHGLYFSYDGYITQKIDLPRFEIRSVVETPNRLSRVLKAWDANHPVSGTFRRLGPSRVQTLAEFNKIFGEDSTAALTRYGTNQISIIGTRFSNLIEMEWLSFSELAKQFPEALAVGKVTVLQEPNTIERAKENLLLRSLKRRLRKPLNQASEVDIHKALEENFLEYIENHELGHVQQGTVRGALPAWVIDHPVFKTFLEVQADFGSSIGTPSADVLLRNLLTPDPIMAYFAGTGHMIDKSYTRNRLAYYFWKNQRGTFAPVEGDIKEFSRLPSLVRRQVWERMPEAPDQEIGAAFQAALNELKQDNNPLRAGLDSTPVEVGNAEVAAAPVESWWTLAHTAEVGGATIAAGGLAVYLYKILDKDDKGGPTNSGSTPTSAPKIPRPSTRKSQKRRPMRRQIMAPFLLFQTPCLAGPHALLVGA